MTQSDIERTLDRLQHEQQLLRNRVTILEALLPKTETIQDVPQVQPEPDRAPQVIVAQSFPVIEPEHQELNILCGMGMTTGARR